MMTLIDNNLQKLTKTKSLWRSLSNSDKIFHIEQSMRNLRLIKDKWIELCVTAKHINPSSQTVAQEWFAGPIVVMRMLRLLKKSLLADGAPHIAEISQNRLGQYVAKVVPTNFYESVLFSPLHADIVLQSGKPNTQGRQYQSRKNTPGELCVVLGAGNVSSMPALDLINQLFVQNNVCFLKFNPVNEYLFEVFEFVFQSLIEGNFLALTKGGAEIGQYLCQHELTDAIHLTGSVRTYQEILKFNKKVTAELGCVTPVIVTPGQWTKRDLRFHAKQIASAVENNASFNCNAMKVLLIDADWQQKNEFLNFLRDEFAHMPLRYAYYPNACERYVEFAKRYPNAELFDGANTRTKVSESNLQRCSTSQLPWMFIPHVDIRSEEYALNHEAFCGLLAVVEVSETKANPQIFLKQAVDICDRFVFGNLSCTLIVDSQTQKKFQSDVESAIANLKYGSIGVNCWAALSYALCATTWGAFPSKTVQSGVGVINNAYFFDYPEKSVIFAPFRQQLKPVWFYDKKNATKIAENLFEFEYSESFYDFLKVGLSAFEIFR